jgi:hypothetical protein
MILGYATLNYLGKIDDPIDNGVFRTTIPTIPKEYIKLDTPELNTKYPTDEDNLKEIMNKYE